MTSHYTKKQLFARLELLRTLDAPWKPAVSFRFQLDAEIGAYLFCAGARFTNWRESHPLVKERAKRSPAAAAIIESGIGTEQIGKLLTCEHITPLRTLRALLVEGKFQELLENYDAAFITKHEDAALAEAERQGIEGKARYDYCNIQLQS